jgi:hypothetical protein
MSSAPTNTAVTVAKAGSSVLQVLADANVYVALGLQLGNLVIPLAKGLIAEIKKIATPTQTETYQVVIQLDAIELADTVQISMSDLVAINAELARMNQAPVPVPPAPPAGS